jgi:hypothetical protein
MKTAAATILVLLLASAGSAAAAQGAAPASTEALRDVVKTYLEIHTLLTQDKFGEVKGPASKLVSQTASLGKAGADVAKAATAFAAAGDLNSARDAFGPLSDALIARVKADGTSGLVSELRIGYCPMNHRSWVQREELAKNPYYGTAMVTCGSVRPVSGPTPPAR